MSYSTEYDSTLKLSDEVQIGPKTTLKSLEVGDIKAGMYQGPTKADDAVTSGSFSVSRSNDIGVVSTVVTPRIQKPSVKAYQKLFNAYRTFDAIVEKIEKLAKILKAFDGEETDYEGVRYSNRDEVYKSIADGYK
jgi:hypothetical protein